MRGGVKHGVYIVSRDDGEGSRVRSEEQRSRYTTVAVNRFCFNHRHLISTVPNVSEDGVNDRVVALVGLLVAVQNGTFRPKSVAPLPLVVHVGPADYLAAEVKSELLRQLETKMSLVVV